MTAPSPPARADWAEVGDRCFARRYEPCDVSIGLVLGSEAALVVDTRCTLAEGTALRTDLRAVTDLPVRFVVNTHWHFDHTFGNAAFTDATIVGHETLPAALGSGAAAVRAEMAACSAAWAADLATTPVVPPTRTFSSVTTLNLGDRLVEIVHPGPAHTAGDAVVRVPDADVVYAGDLVEESGPLCYGDDSFPLAWPAALDFVVGLLTGRTAVVPGHGAVVAQPFVEEQRQAAVDVAANIQDLATRGVPAADAATADVLTPWPFPVAGLQAAVRRGYAALGVSGTAGPPA